MILDSFLDDDCLGEVLLEPLIVKCHGSTIENLLLAITEAVVFGIKLPFVVPFLLLSWRVVAMRFLVHLVHLLVVAHEGAAHWVQHLLCVFETRAGHTEGYGTILSLFGPLITPREALSEWLALVRCILVFLDVVELVSEAR